MQDVAKNAYEIQFHTGTVSFVDIVIDKAALDTIYAMERPLKVNFLANTWS